MHEDRGAWTPLFTGQDAVEFRDSVATVVKEVEGHAAPVQDWGRGLLHAYLAKAYGDKASQRVAEAVVDEQLQWMETKFAADRLYGGFVGCGWLSAHLGRLFGHTDESLFDEFDPMAADICRRRKGAEYDLISGSVGFGVYFLERLPAAGGQKGLATVVELLRASVEHRREGATWYTPTSLMPEWQRTAAPGGYYNLGVAHGVPGVVALLAEIQKAGCLDVEDLLRASARWVLAHRLPGGGFPAWEVQGSEQYRSRVAWCYGELGVAVSLLMAAQALGDIELREAATDIALEAATRRETAGVKDTGLCHGAAGNGHLFNRLYQATRHPGFRDAAEYWFRTTLEMRVNGAGIAGYQTSSVPEGGSLDTPVLRDEPAFLTGATGTALALLAAITAVEPYWDRVLLAGVTPLSARFDN